MSAGSCYAGDSAGGGRRFPATGGGITGIRVIRLIVQLAFLALFLAMAWAASYPPSRIYSDNLFLRADPLVALTTALRGFDLTLALPALALLSLTVLSGRFFCAWICPLGTFFDLVPSLGRRRGRGLRARRPHPLFGRRGKGEGGRVRLKYLGVVLVVSLQAAGVGILWLYDPLVIANRAMLFALSGAIPFVFLALLLLAAFYHPRFWCQELCPTGAFLSAASALGKGLPERASPLALRKDEGACIHCGRCAAACPFEITAVAEGRRSGRLALADCSLCGQCVASCPRRGALALTSFGATLLASGAGGEKGMSGEEAVSVG